MVQKCLVSGISDVDVAALLLYEVPYHTKTSIPVRKMIVGIISELSTLELPASRGM